MRAVLLTWAWTTRTSPREALDGFFCRRGEAGRFYCAACLAQCLRRGVGAFPPAAVKAAVADAFERPGLLRLKPRKPARDPSTRICAQDWKSSDIDNSLRLAASNLPKNQQIAPRIRGSTCSELQGERGE